MENRAHALAAGLFVVILTAALALVAIWLGGDAVERVSYRLISTTPIAGLNPKAPVRWRGVDIGTVEEIRFDRDDPHRLIIDISVDKSVPLPRGTYAQMGLQGITGLSFVQLDDNGQAKGQLEPPGPIEVRPSLIDQVSESGQQLVVDAGEMVRRINVLLSDDNLAGIAQTLANLEAASGRIAVASDSLPGVINRADSTLRKLDPLLTNLDALAVDLRARVDVVDRAGAGLDKLGRASESIEHALLDTTLPKINLLTEQLLRDTRLLEQVLYDVRDRPQSFIFGREQPMPGPGEPGFDASTHNVVGDKAVGDK